MGSGTAFKLIYNLMGATQIAALAEGLVAAEAAGIDPRTAARAISTGATGSPHVVRHAAFMADGNHEDPPAFTARGRIKDSTYGVEFTEQLGCQALLGRATIAVFSQMVAMGLREAADSRLVDAVRAGRKGPDSGVELR
ncbi:MAG: NAD-binding protein [Acidobacteriota bacterium]